MAYDNLNVVETFKEMKERGNNPQKVVGVTISSLSYLFGSIWFKRNPYNVNLIFSLE